MRRCYHGVRVAGRVLAALLLLPLALVLILYVSAPVYQMEERKPFHGDGWFNPYAALDTAAGRWLQANFHAHSTAWGGTTEGRQSPARVVAAYRTMRYDVIGLSNYHALPPAALDGAFPVFEHGWNVFKSHRLAIGASRVVWWDYAFGQHAQHKQDLIRRLRDADAVVAIAHPAMRDGHTLEDLRRLSGYDALEVLNHYLPPAEAHWDAALSSGRAVWILANDDSHDVNGSGETGLHWTLVHARSPAPADVKHAIRSGRTIGVRGAGGQSSLRFHALTMRGDTMTVRVSGRVRAIEFIGQEGRVRRRLSVDSLDRAGDTVVAQVVASSDDGYLRTVVLGHEPSARHMYGSALYLNPVIRGTGALPSAVVPAIDVPLTRTLRLAIGVGLLGVFYVRSRRTRRRRGQTRRRHRSPVPSPLPA